MILLLRTILWIFLYLVCRPRSLGDTTTLPCSRKLLVFEKFGRSPTPDQIVFGFELFFVTGPHIVGLQNAKRITVLSWIVYEKKFFSKIKTRLCLPVKNFKPTVYYYRPTVTWPIHVCTKLVGKGIVECIFKIHIYLQKNCQKKNCSKLPKFCVLRYFKTL